MLPDQAPDQHVTEGFQIDGWPRTKKYTYSFLAKEIQTRTQSSEGGNLSVPDSDGSISGITEVKDFLTIDR